jgi:hypothetical protein
MSLTLLGAGPGSPGAGNPLFTGLLSYWHLADLTDSVGSNTWNPFGPTHFGAVTIPGVGAAHAYDFGAGGADVLNSDIGFNGPSLDLFNQDFSFSFWMFPTNVGAYSAPFGRRDLTPGNYVVELVADDASFGFYINAASGQHRSGPGTALLNTWQNVICTYTLADLTPRIYVNNVLGTGIQVPSAIVSYPTTTERVGSGGANYTHGQVGEIGIWNRLLTPTERATLQTKIYPFT